MSLRLREAISFSELYLFKGVLTHRTFQTNEAMQFEKKKNMDVRIPPNQRKTFVFSQ